MPSYESTTMTLDELAKLTGLSTSRVQIADENEHRQDQMRIAESHFRYPYLILKSIDRAMLVSGGNLFALER
jgi:hypothetical protein